MIDKIITYRRKTHYYETDQMGIIHHSNYIRWFEEARTDMLDQAGFGYDHMEKEGITIPVLGVSCEYKSMVRYGETVNIYQKIRHFDGIRMTISYEVTDEKTGMIRACGETRHCFINDKGKPVSLKHYVAIYEVFSDLVAMSADSATGLPIL